MLPFCVPSAGTKLAEGAPVDVARTQSPARRKRVRLLVAGAMAVAAALVAVIVRSPSAGAASVPRLARGQPRREAALEEGSLSGEPGKRSPRLSGTSLASEGDDGVERRCAPRRDHAEDEADAGAHTERDDRRGRGRLHGYRQRLADADGSERR